MKSTFNKNWKSSVQPRKQRKFKANAPNHISRKFMSAKLDKTLKEKLGRRNLEIRKGDEVNVMSGRFKLKKGKVSIVDIKNSRIQIDGVTRTKKGGEKIPTWLHASKVKIVTLNETDKKRLKNSLKKQENKTEKKSETKTETKTESKQETKLNKKETK